MRRPAALQVLGAVYLIWRALRSLNSGWNYFYSIPFWCAVPNCHALAPARMPACLPACLHARRHWGSPGGWPAVMHAAAAAATNLVATRVRSGLLTWPAMCRLSRLAEFMAYCLSYCFVTSLFYMVSWRQQSARAGRVCKDLQHRIRTVGIARTAHCPTHSCPQSCVGSAVRALPAPWHCPDYALPLPCR